MKIFFFGAPSFSAEILKNLLQEKINIDYLITHPDKKIGRQQKLTANPTKLLAQKTGLPIKEFAHLDKKSLNFFQEEKADLFIVAAYGQLIPKEILQSARLGALNIHPSLLPKLRGPAPIQTALQQGLKKTGTSIMLMTEKMDAGPIIYQEEISIKNDDCYPQLEKKLIKLSGRLINKTIDYIKKEGKLPPAQPQDEKQATYSQLIKKQDGLINWQETAEQIYNRWRAFCQWPQVYSFYRGEKIILKEIKLSPIQQPQLKPGTIFSANGQILIQTGKNSLKIIKLQLAGKKETSIHDFLNGHPHFISAQLTAK